MFLFAGFELMCQISPSLWRNTVLFKILLSSSKSRRWTYNKMGKANNSNLVLYNAFYNNRIKCPGHWTKNIPLVFLSSFGSIQPWATVVLQKLFIHNINLYPSRWRSKGFFIHNINLYPHRYPFIPLGEEKQLYSMKNLAHRTQVSWLGFEPTLRCWQIRAQLHGSANRRILRLRSPFSACTASAEFLH